MYSDDFLCSVTVLPSMCHKDLDPLEIGGNISWKVPAVDERVKLYRVYVANSPAGAGRFQVGQDSTATELAVLPETPLPAQPQLGKDSTYSTSLHLIASGICWCTLSRPSLSSSSEIQWFVGVARPHSGSSLRTTPVWLAISEPWDSITTYCI